jgi:hypothetical protein
MLSIGGDYVVRQASLFMGETNAFGAVGPKAYAAERIAHDEHT